MLRNRLDCLSIKFFPFEHKVLRELRSHGVADGFALVAVSGGLDSLLLLLVLRRLRSALKLNIYAVYVHHGEGSKAQMRYRNRAQKFVEKFCKKIEVPFLTNKKWPKAEFKSEEELRNFRYREMNKFRKKIARQSGQAQLPLLFLAHHRDDLVETQLIRLVRGTGLRGMEAMTYVNEDGRVRPFLNFSRSELEALAKKLGLKWIEDPSNQNIDPLRNWMRYFWLAHLEKKIPGARASLSRSLSLISQAQTDEFRVATLIHLDGIDRQGYMALSRIRKHELLAEYLRQLKIRNFSAGHIEEIFRRLDNGRVHSTFSLLRHDWSVNENRIRAILSTLHLRKVKS